jgi:hypothetical protein
MYLVKKSDVIEKNETIRNAFFDCLASQNGMLRCRRVRFSYSLAHGLALLTFMKYLIKREVTLTENYGTLFRENTINSKYVPTRDSFHFHCPF